MTLKLCSIAAALALALGTTAVQAQQTRGTAADKPATAPSASTRSAARDEQKAEKEKIEADYKAAKAKCDGMQGNQKDVCMKEAKGHEKVAKAELDAKKNPSARNERKVAEAKADADYDVAKEKCEGMKGAEKSACTKDAKAKHNQAKADIKRQYASRSKTERPARSATTGSTSGTAAGTSRSESTTK